MTNYIYKHHELCGGILFGLALTMMLLPIFGLSEAFLISGILLALFSIFLYFSKGNND